MLKGVKAMILQKNAYLEAAQILFEDARENNLDDLIILNEAGDNHDVEDDDIDDLPNDDENKDDDSEDDEEISDDNDDSIEDDLLNSSMDDEPNPSTLDDDLPAGIGGIQDNDSIDDFLNVNIDLRSNTITDVLPVPPNNASEAINDDIFNTRIDSGFEEANPGGFPMGVEENKDIEETELKESLYNDDIFSEAISLNGETDQTQGDTSSDISTSEEPPEEGDNDVTSAVKDKVAEADAPIEDGDVKGTGKEDLLKKLGSITKSLEDAKKAIMNTLQ